MCNRFYDRIDAHARLRSHKHKTNYGKNCPFSIEMKEDEKKKKVECLEFRFHRNGKSRIEWAKMCHSKMNVNDNYIELGRWASDTKAKWYTIQQRADKEITLNRIDNMDALAQSTMVLNSDSDSIFQSPRVSVLLWRCSRTNCKRD